MTKEELQKKLEEGDLAMTKAQKLRIYEHWKRGGSLCCGPGLEFLKTVLPKAKARRFNEWAYHELSCKDTDAEDRRTHQTRKLLEKLAVVFTS